MTLPLVLALLIGIVTGLRTVTGVAALAVAGYYGWLDFEHGWLSWLASPVTAVVLVVLAVAELVADKLPKTPSRVAVPGLSGRVVFGGFCGAALATAADVGTGGLVGAVILGVVGALAGAFGGHRARTKLAAQTRDLPVALAEDALAIVGAALVVYAALRHL